MSLVYGFITGVVFGFFLQRAHVLRYDKQVGALRLVDMMIFKFMLNAIVVASIGIYLLKDLGLIKLSMKGTSIGAQLVGGTLFGVGWGILGYCPGTAAGVLGEGRFEGFWGILGMLCGGGLYAAAYPFAKTYIIGIGNYGKIGLPEVLGLNHWVVILLFAILCVLLFVFFEKKKL